MKIFENSRYWARINGTPISELGFMLGENGIKIARPELKTSSVTVPGLSGALDTTLEDETMRAFMNPIEISINLIAVGDTDEIRAVRANLIRLEGRRGTLSCYFTEGEWRGRWHISEMEEHGKSSRALAATLTLSAQPWAYGRKNTVQLKSRETQINVTGNVPCWPRFEMRVDTDVLRITHNSGAFLEFDIGVHLNGTLIASTAPERREYTINGNHILPTVDSTCFALRPGINTITCDDCSGVLTFCPQTIY